MKTYSEGSKGYTQVKTILETGNADVMVEKLAKVTNADFQLAYINTMYAIIARDFSYPQSSTGSIAMDIRFQQNVKIQRYGEKAFPLSEKQLGVIARDLAGMVALKNA